MTSNVLDEDKRRIEEEQQEIRPKNNRGKEHYYESINSQFISKNIVETGYICLECGNLKYVYNYLEDSEL